MGHGTGSVLPHRLQACVLPRGKISLLQFISRLKAGNVTAWLLLHCRGMQFMWKSAASTLSYHTAKNTACWRAGGGFAMLTDSSTRFSCWASMPWPSYLTPTSPYAVLEPSTEQTVSSPATWGRQACSMDMSITGWLCGHIDLFAFAFLAMCC